MFRFPLMVLAIGVALVSGCGGGKEASTPPPVLVHDSPPSILTQPVSQAVAEGQTATFSVVATGSRVLDYQWRRDGADLPGATTASYTTSATTVSDEGAVFSVLITNDFGSIASTGAVLTVQPPGYRFPDPLSARTTRADIRTLVTGETYYLDAVNGSDATGIGTTLLPWKSLAKVHTVLQSGDCVLFRSGNYGAFTEETIRSRPTVYMAEEGQSPVLNRIALRDNDAPNHVIGNPGTAYLANLIFFGFSIVPEYVDPGPTDPMDAQATGSTYAKCTPAVDLKWYGAIRLVDCRMLPPEAYGASGKFLSPSAVNLVYAPEVWIEGCDLDGFGSGISYTASPRLRIYYNKIHGVAGGMVSGKDALSLDAVIEGNHLFDSNWALTDPYCPRRAEADYHHGSFMSVRGCDTVVRNNIMHFGCNSSGMMLYDDEHIPLENILIEGNQIYDSNNVYALRLYNVNRNVVVRNNTLISKGRFGSMNEWKYNTALAVHSFLGSAGGERLSIHNNVMVGNIGLPVSLDGIELAGNLVYSAPMALPAGNTVAYPGNSGYFESGFFAGALDVSWQNWENDGAGFANPRGHGRLLDLRPAAGSPAIGHGILALQAPTRIGGMDAEGFLELSVPRSTTGPNAGSLDP